ncbi:hypothetical protein [Ktedonospora formicarum]|uniref:Uncharacterized protein n=1 Tax=Ktedonospora formicarum TaxID=2778364 RepID=A0A8J3IC17_9CHLR|nr:hypothetical protein [Ktedonospora formicarum]GHO49324.1 hypothetical protein KSX_74870 [Ktedonospora formicarum]
MTELARSVPMPSLIFREVSTIKTSGSLGGHEPAPDHLVCATFITHMDQRWQPIYSYPIV